jgi:hypothetical protein
MYDDSNGASVDAHNYHIRVSGHLDERWFDWFAGLTIAHTPDGETAIVGTALDQSALYAILDRLRDLGLELLAVQRDPGGEVHHRSTENPS